MLQIWQMDRGAAPRTGPNDQYGDSSFVNSLQIRGEAVKGGRAPSYVRKRGFCCDEMRMDKAAAFEVGAER